jgi:hypothetical protein
LILFFFELASIKNIIRDYHSLIGRLESEKIDLEYEVARKDYEARTPFSCILLIEKNIIFFLFKFKRLNQINQNQYRLI